MTMRSTSAAIIFGHCNGKLNVCVVWISSLQVRVFICPAALRLMMSTAELVITQALDHFEGNTSSHAKREEVLIQRRYRVMLLDHEVDGCGDHIWIPHCITRRLHSLHR